MGGGVDILTTVDLSLRVWGDLNFDGFEADGIQNTYFKFEVLNPEKLKDKTLRVEFQFLNNSEYLYKVTLNLSKDKKLLQNYDMSADSFIDLDALTGNSIGNGTVYFRTLYIYCDDTLLYGFANTQSPSDIRHFYKLNYPAEVLTWKNNLACPYDCINCQVRVPIMF